MPIVINEITISVDVAPAGTASTSATTSPGNTFSMEDIVRECVEKVMEIINQKNER